MAWGRRLPYQRLTQASLFVGLPLGLSLYGRRGDPTYTSAEVGEHYSAATGCVGAVAGWQDGRMGIACMMQQGLTHTRGPTPRGARVLNLTPEGGGGGGANTPTPDCLDLGACKPESAVATEA